MRAPSDKPQAVLPKHWWRLKRSLSRRWREWRLPRGFERLGTRYGGWWLFAPAISPQPLLVDCGLGNDISFTVEFLQRFGGRVIGIDPNPAALGYARANCPAGMEVRDAAFWKEAGRELRFHLPGPSEQLPHGADGVSGSLLASHAYARGATRMVRTTSLVEVLASAERHECDVLKLDIEGAEYEVLEALCSSGDIHRVRQLLVEFHHQWTDHSFEESLDAVTRLEANGFKLRHWEDRNCTFLRRDAAHAS